MLKFKFTPEERQRISVVLVTLTKGAVANYSTALNEIEDIINQGWQTCE